MFYKCYSNLTDTFKVIYAAKKAFNCMCSKGGGGQLIITDKKIESRQEAF